MQPVKKDLISVRREKINQKKEQYKALAAVAVVRKDRHVEFTRLNPIIPKGWATKIERQ